MANAHGKLSLLAAVALLATACGVMPAYSPPLPTPSGAHGQAALDATTTTAPTATPTRAPVAGSTPRLTPTASRPRPTPPPPTRRVPAASATPIPRASAAPGVLGPTPTPRAVCPEVQPVAITFVTPAADKPSEGLRRVLAAALAGRQGNFGVAVKHLQTGEWAAINESRVYEAASLYKLNLLYGVYALAGKGVSLTDVLTISEKAAYYYGDGEPSLLPGETTTVADAVRCAITVSDNTSAHALLEYLPIWRVNDLMRRLGLRETEIDQGTRTSPRDMLRLLELIAAGRAVSPEASRAMLQLLLAQRVNDRLPLLLPEGVAVAHKTGNLSGLRHDVGIVYSPAGAYVICVLADGLPDSSPEHPDPGSRGIAEVSRVVYDYFAQRSPTR